jgi:hypothetical protein
LLALLGLLRNGRIRHFCRCYDMLWYDTVCTILCSAFN